MFDERIGTIQNQYAQLHLKESATPLYYRPHAVPFALKTSVEAELDRLVSEGILEQVKTSKWAAPIVIVPKKHGKIRICRDYKVTINTFLDVDVHPLPKPEELFASLAGGQKFMKIDLSQAYQQLRLDNGSRELVTINTHRGLYRYSHLPFGVSSAPAIFQWFMDSLLCGY